MPAAPMAQQPPAGAGQVVTLHDAAGAAKPPATPTASPASLIDGGSSATASGSSSVAIQDGSSQSAYRFAPSALTVAAGTKVVWTNDGQQPHNVTGDGLGSSTLNHGNTYQFTFNTPGTYNYKCTIHPYMKGSVKVTDTSSGGGSSGNSGSGGGSSGSGTGSASTTPSATTATGSAPASSTASGGSSGSLPSTGLDALLMAEVGLALLLAGFVLRSRRA
jgi:plastocyanin